MVGREMDRDQTRVMDSVLAGLEVTRRPRLRPPDAAPLPLVPPPPPAGGTRTVRGSPASTSTPVGRPWLVDQGWQRHLLQTGYVDRMLHARPARGDRALRRRPRRARRGSRCLVPAGRAPPRRDRREPRGHRLRPPPHEGPGQVEDRVDDRHVRTIDVLPTVADLLGMTLPADVDGRSMLAPNYRATREVRVFRRAGEAPVGRPFASVLAQRGATLGARRRSSAPAGPSSTGPVPTPAARARSGRFVVRDREGTNARPARPPRGVRPQGRALSVARERAAGRRGARERPAPARRLGERAHRGGDEDVSRRRRRRPLLGARARVGLPAGREPGGRLRRLGGGASCSSGWRSTVETAEPPRARGAVSGRAPARRRPSRHPARPRAPPYALATCVRAERWHGIVRRAGVETTRGETYRLTTVGYMGNNVLPARSGDVLRAFLLAPRAGTGSGRAGDGRRGAAPRRRRPASSSRSWRSGCCGRSTSPAAGRLFSPSQVEPHSPACASSRSSWPAEMEPLSRVRGVVRPLAAPTRGLASRHGVGLLALSVAVWILAVSGRRVSGSSWGTRCRLRHGAHEPVRAGAGSARPPPGRSTPPSCSRWARST